MPYHPVWFFVLWICILPLTSCALIAFDCHRKAASDRRKRADEPKKVSRKRRKLSTSANYAPNVECALLRRLPVELRLEIYTHVLGENLLHVYHVPGRLAHKCCRTQSKESENWRLDPNCCRTSRETNLVSEVLELYSTVVDIALLQTCRQIYVEAIKILYATNTFDINHLQTLIYLSKSVPIQHFATISTLYVTWKSVSYHSQVNGIEDWDMFCHVVATKMPGLRHFKLLICDKYGSLSMPDDPHQDWIEPLLAIRGLRTFDLLTYQPGSISRPIEVPKLQHCMRQLFCTYTTAPTPRSEEVNGSKYRKLWKWKSPKPSNLDPSNMADFRQIVEMTQ